MGGLRLDKVTHVMDIRLAIDFGKLTNPDVINGVKAVLGTSESGIMESYSKLLTDAIISKIIDGRNDHLAMIDVELKEVSSVVGQNGKMSEEDISDYMEEVLSDSETSVEEEIIPLNIVPEEKKDSEEEDKVELFNLYDEIDGQIFKIASYGGEEVIIALTKRLYAKYGAYIENKMEVPVEIMDSKTESEGIDYAITYKDIEKNIKIIKQDKEESK